MRKGKQTSCEIIRLLQVATLSLRAEITAKQITHWGRRRIRQVYTPAHIEDLLAKASRSYGRLRA